MNPTHTQINDHLLFDFPDVNKADALIILGAKSVSGEIARQVVDFYQKPNTHINKIIISGGNSVFEPLVGGLLKLKNFTSPDLDLSIPNATDFLNTKKEANYIRDIIKDSDIPANDIILTETLSTNTGENFKNIKSCINDFNIKSAVVAVVAYSQRRAIETGHKVLGDNIDLFPRAVYPFGITRDTWPHIHYKPVTSGINGIVRGEFNKTTFDHSDNYYGNGNGQDYATPINNDELTALKSKAQKFII